MAVGWKESTSLMSLPVSKMTGQSPDWPADEPTGISGAGRFLYWNLCCDRFIGGVDLLSPNSSFPNQGTNRQWRYVEGSAQPPAGSLPTGYHLSSLPYYWHPGTTSVNFYWSHGLNVGPSIYDGKIFVIRSNTVIAFSPEGAGKFAPVLPAVPSESASPLNETITEDELKNLLENQVQKILSAGHLKPGYGIVGNYDSRARTELGEELLDYWHNPADIQYFLLRALPLLSTPLQDQVRLYLQSEFSSFPPNLYVHVGWKSGVFRESVDFPPPTYSNITNKNPSSRSGYPAWELPPHNIYAIWKYAEEGLGDPSTLFTSIKTKLKAPITANKTLLTDDYLASSPHVHNSYIAGYLGYIELAKLAGIPLTTYQPFENELNRLLSLRAAQFKSNLTPHSTLGSVAKLYYYTLVHSWNFLYLTPELADYLNQNAFFQVQEAVDAYTNQNPYWMVPLNKEVQGEGGLSPYEQSYALFQAYALILKQSPIQLTQYLDAPIVPVGDLYYIDELVSILDAIGSGEEPTPTVSETPTPTETFTPSATETPTPSDSPTPTETETPTFTDTPTPTDTPTQSETPTPPETATSIPSDTPTPTSTQTLAPTATETPFPSETLTPTETSTATNTPTSTETETSTPTDTPTPTQTQMATDTVTPTPSETQPPTATDTSTPTDSPTPSATQTLTPTATETSAPTDTPTLTITQTSTATETPTPTEISPPTATKTLTQTATETHTPTPTETFTPTLADTETPTPAPTQTETPTATETPSPSETPTSKATEAPTPTETITASETPTHTYTPSPTNTPTLIPSESPTTTDTPTETMTPTPSETSIPTDTPIPTATHTPTATETPIPTETPTPTPTATETPTPSETTTPTESPTATEAPKPTNTPTPTDTPTQSETPTPTNTPTSTVTETPTPTDTLTPTPSETPTPTYSPTPTVTETPTPTETLAPTVTENPTPTETSTPTASDTPTPTDSPTSIATDTSTPTDTPTPTASETPTPTHSPTPTVTETPTPTGTFTPTATSTPVPEVIFADGFESGDLLNWSSSTIDNGDLSAQPSAVLIGSYGMQAVIDDNTAIYVADDSPTAESRYRARFYFDPNSISMGNSNAHYIFYGYSSATTVVLRVELRYFKGTYQIRTGLPDDTVGWTNSAFFTISDDQHYIELDWQAAITPSSNDGSLTFWIDGLQVAILLAVDNDTHRIDHIRIGAVDGIDKGTRGTYYFDAFESRQTTYIGEESESLSPLTGGYNWDLLYVP
jgi:hypothetical protein